MDLPEDELFFLRDLVKASRQRTQVVAWVDRDGSKRQTALTAAEAKRLSVLAQRRGVSTAELLRQAAFVPVAPPSKTPAEGS